MRYPWILFDADGTLFDYDRSESTALRALWASAGLPKQAGLLDAYRRINGALWRRFEAGEVTASEIKTRRFETLLDDLGLAGDPDLLSSLYLEHLGCQTHLLPGAGELVDWLSRSRRMALITNGLTRVQRCRLAKSSIGDCFEVVVISEEVGYAKLDPRIFETAFVAMGRPPKRDVLMVGDNLLADIQGAERFGFETCWLNLSGRATRDGVEPGYEIESLAKLRCLLEL